MTIWIFLWENSKYHLAKILVDTMKAEKTKLVTVDGESYFGSGYQDVNLRVPAIQHAEKYLNWKPQVDLKEGVLRTVKYYLDMH